MVNKRKSTNLKPKQKKFLEVFIKKMGHITDTCKEVGINRATYYLWLKESKFMEALDESMEHFHDSVQRRILSLAMKDNEKMLMFWAKNQMQHRGWTERQEIQISGNMGVSLVEELNHAYDDYKQTSRTRKG